MLIYHGDPVGNSRRRAEEKLYDPRVVVRFNETAWATSETLQYWLKRMFSVAQDYPSSDNEPGLLSLDAFAPQMTKEMRNHLRKINVTPSYIPGVALDSFKSWMFLSTSQ
jgi:DDE superfamily endonuclease